MHGFVLNRLESFVVESYGAETWQEILREAGLAGKEYVRLVEYPDEDVEALVKAAAKVAGRSESAILRLFGSSIGRDLIRIYRPLLDPSWQALDVLEHTEETIHDVVRTRNQGAAPPFLTARRDGPEQVTILYDSPRRMCSLARGIVLGIAEHFEQRVEITEETCMHRGDDRCTLRVETASA